MVFENCRGVSLINGIVFFLAFFLRSWLNVLVRKIQYGDKKNIISGVKKTIEVSEGGEARTPVSHRRRYSSSRLGA